MNDTYRWDVPFIGRGNIPATSTSANLGDPFMATVTGGTSTSPCVRGYVDGPSGGVGVARVGFTTANEAQNICISFGDVLNIDIDNVLRAYFRMRVATAFGTHASTMLAFGLTGDRNDAIDSIAQNLLFRRIADGTVIVESDDGTTDLDDKATSLNLSATTWKWFGIDFSNSKSDVRFFMQDANGFMKRVAASTTFDVDQYAGALQFFLQIQKNSANAGALDIDHFSLDYRLLNT